MRLQVREVSEGPGPGEVVVEVTTTSGRTEQVIIHAEDIKDNTIEIGFPIHRADGKSLIELPRESMSGRWRVWVPSSNVAMT